MTPRKWYEDIWISVVFTPLCWRLRAFTEPMWQHAQLDVGPFSFNIGWPKLSTANNSI